MDSDPDHSTHAPPSHLALSPLQGHLDRSGTGSPLVTSASLPRYVTVYSSQMPEAERGAPPTDTISQQLTAISQTVTRLHENHILLEERFLALAAPPKTDDSALPGDSHSEDGSDPVGQQPVTPSWTVPLPEPRVPLPERFSGDRHQFRTFKNACQLFFLLQPRTFSTETVKVRFTISLLLGEPQSWAHRLLERHSPTLVSTTSFFQAMAQLYEDPLQSDTAEATLHNLRQNTRPVEDYIAEFRRWSGDTEWNEAALRAQFRLGLADQLKDELARIAEPDSLEGLILRTIQIDRRLRKRRAEKIQSERMIKCSIRVPDQPSPAPIAMGGIEFQHTGLPRPALSPTEKLRRRQANLCLYCGGPGHYLLNCPVRPARHDAPVFTHLQVSENQLSFLTVSISLQVKGREVPLLAIIDSGAGNCFMDDSLARELQLPIIPKRQPVTIHLADGTAPKAGPVRFETLPIPAAISTHHREFLRFDLFHSPMYPVILGMPWLQAHNPIINWATRSISFLSEYCRLHCWSPEQGEAAPLLCTQSKVLEKQLVPKAYQDFADVFDKQKADDLPPHRAYDCPIELLPGAKIPFGRIYPLSEPELEALRQYIDENLKKGFIRPSSSPAGAGIFFVEKKDHSLRPCIDYRELNRITVKNRYPLPLVPELFQRLRSARVFTKLDLRGAYNLVRIREGDEWKTAFRTRFGHFEYLVMPFGLCNAPATFQHLVNDIFREFLDLFVIVYLDDILVFSSSIEEHQIHVREVLTTLRKHKLFAKVEKCEFERESIQFLGLIISTGGISMDPQKVSAILEWPVPTDKKGVQRFVGFANFYRRFIKNFSAIILPITKLTQQSMHFQWSPEAQTAFDTLKTQFTSAPVLQHPDPALPYVLEVDASETAIGAILSQRQGPKSLLHPVAFFSRKLSPPERNYDVGDRELLAMKAALEEWRYLLEGATHPILVFTDHKNLEYLRTAKRLRPRQARWALFFSRFVFHISYRPGSKNGKPDALSRMFPEPQAPAVPDTILSPQNFLLLQPDLTSALRQASIASPEPETQALLRKDGLFWHGNKIFIPKSMRPRILSSCHDSPLAGHFGVRKTAELVRRSFWWADLNKDCKIYVKTCTTCLRSKSDRARPWGLLRPLPIPKRPWDMIAMDFIVELPPSEDYTTIFVVVDRLSKMAHFIPMVGTPSAAETARTFIKEIIRLHGIPSSVVSDRGSQFTSKFWKSLCGALKINICLSSAYHPQSNGQTERTNQTLEQYLRCFSTFSQDDWAPLLPLAEFSYNNSVHSATNQTPFWANYGFHPSFLPDDIPEAEVPAVQDKLAFLQTNNRLLQTTMQKAQEGYKRAYDSKRRGELPLEIGDKAWLSTANLKLSCPSRKLGPRFIGPFTVKRKVNPVAFELCLPESYRIHPVFHASLLKPTTPDPFPGRVVMPPPPVTVGDNLEYEVEAILDCRKRQGRTQYLVKWQGYGPEENSWEPASHLHAPRLLQDFKNRHPEKMAQMGIRRLPVGGGHCQDRRDRSVSSRVSARRRT